MRDIGAKCRKCRRSGVKLYLKGTKCFSDKCPLSLRQTPPGERKGFRRRTSDYGFQLREKQKVKWMYGMTEKQFRKFFKQACKEAATHEEVDRGERFLQLLELRLDNILYRAGVTVSRQTARQLVNHGHIKVKKSGKKEFNKCDIPSRIMEKGDKVSVSVEAVKKLQNQGKDPREKFAEWLEVAGNEITIKRLPSTEEGEIGEGISEEKIVEFYSR